jgi:hypothetical protein
VVVDLRVATTTSMYHSPAMTNRLSPRPPNQIAQSRRLEMWRSVLILLIVILAGLPAAVAACSPGAPQPWFHEQLSFGPDNLPSKIVFLPDTSTDVTTIYVANPYKTPLQILVDPEGSPAVTIIENRWYRGASEQGIAQEEGRELVREAIRPPLPVSAPPIGDGRPSDFRLPPAHHANIHVRFGQHYVAVPVTMKYELTEVYDPYAQARAARDCEYGKITPLLVCLLPLFFVVLALGSVGVRAIIDWIRSHV